MTPALKWGLALGGLAVGAIAAIAASSPAAAAAPAPVPPQGSTVWIRATRVPVGTAVRLSLPASALAQIAQQNPGVITADLAGFSAMLSFFSSGAVQVWGPAGPGATPLPADWPADDVGAATEYHAQFTVTGAPFVLPGDPSAPPTITEPTLIGWMPKP